MAYAKLYPKSEQPFDAADFKNPSAEYRAAPFWAWNSRLDAAELTRQIGELKQMGFGGFHIHVRTGLATEYLGDEYLALVRACIDKAREERMLPWLYDEDRWPSGAAGGLVTRDERYRQRRLRVTRHPERADGVCLACFEASLDQDGALAAYRRIDPAAEAVGIKLYAFLEKAAPDPWFNNQTYVDTLNPLAVRAFLDRTHERYYQSFAADFGSLIPAIFTDEPQCARKTTLPFAHDDADVLLPWTDDLADTCREAYPGENLLDGIPELLWELPGGRVSPLRYHYHDHVTERFTRAFADQCGAWCAAHGIMLTGHLDEEPTLASQTHSLGEAMRAYRSFQLPGIDMLCDRREFTTAKQAQSAARQYGCPGVLSELYGVTNWDFDFRQHKLQGDWQAALGVTLRVPHLSWVSMNGEAKRDYPGTFGYQAPWYREYPYVEDHFARLNTVLSRGKALAQAAVIHPIESYWLHWGPGENTLAVREAMDRKFRDLCEWLLRGLIDFDYVCESTLPALCDPAAIQSGARFPVGNMSYALVIVPGLETIRATTLARLEAFSQAGGRIIFLGEAPAYLDAQPSGAPRLLWERCALRDRLGFERLPLLDALSWVRDIEIRDHTGAPVQDLLYQLREEAAGVRWLFIAHADKPANPDLPQEARLRIRLKGEWRAVHCDTLTGDLVPQAAACEGGDTLIRCSMYEHDSLLFKLERGGGAALPAAAADTARAHGSPAAYPHDGESCLRFTGPVPVTLHEPNVLLLDMAEYALDGDAYRPAEEVLRLDSLLREALGWPLRKKAVAQPWVEQDASTPRRLRLRYRFMSEIEIPGAELALENAAAAQVTLNGAQAGAVNGWYADRGIGKLPLPVIRQGANMLELTLPYGRKTDVEALYLLGDFGVDVAGVRCTLRAPVRELAFGDITRQGLAFYGGNITYHLEAESRNGCLAITAASYRGPLLRVKVDGEDRGVIAYSPYRLEMRGLGNGPRRIELICYGCRINTFGQLHANVRRDGFWWGPDSWRTSGPAWTYEYRFWPQGVLKSPEIEITGN